MGDDLMSEIRVKPWVLFVAKEAEINEERDTLTGETLIQLTHPNWEQDSYYETEDAALAASDKMYARLDVLGVRVEEL